MIEFTCCEWDVLLFVESFRVVFSVSPSRDAILAKGLDPRAVKNLLRKGYLRENRGKLEVVREMFEELIPTAG